LSSEFGAVRQAGYVVRDIEREMNHWTQALGVGPFFYIERLPLQHFVYQGQPSAPHLSVALGYSGEVQVELIAQRNDAPSMWHEFLDAGHEGLHHVAFWTREFDQHLAKLTGRGLQVEHSGRSGSGGPDERFAYLWRAPGDPHVIELSEMGGRKVEIYEMVANAARTWDGSDPIRELPGGTSAHSGV
jgi:Glyoxalase/Bleomycin resistance protein/Dioxygenase superfamily